MILRRPYAFFIKHFKLFHFIMFVFLGIITYRTNLVRSFFNEYIGQIAYTISENIVLELFSNLTYVLAAFIIISSILIFLVMNKKEKPALFYALTILMTFSTIAFLIYSQVVVYRLQTELISVTVLRAITDISNILVLVQAVFLLILFIRAVGFDIRKFDFGKDIQELNISAEDNEEYEVQFDFDKNEFKRNLRKNKREFKYFLIENKKMIIFLSSLSVVIISALVYFNFSRFFKSYNLNTFFTTEDFVLKVNNSYLTQNNYKNSKVTDNYLIAVLLEIKNSNNVINISKTQLKVGRAIYYPIDSKYTESLADLGKVYNSEKLSKETNKYILVYEIPEALKNEKISFIYIDNYSRTMFGEKYRQNKVDLKPIDLDNNKQNYGSILEDKLEFNNDFIKGNFVVTNYEIKDMFVSTYNTCVSKDECYDLNQYLQPSFTGYQDKAILKLNAILNYDEESIIKEDLFNLISKYGRIVYTINEKTYSTKDIKSTNFSIEKDKNNFYAEVPKALEEADSIDLVFNIRNNEYTYTLK